MRDSSSASKRQHEAHAVITKNEFGWTIRLVREDPGERYAPVSKERVEKAVKRLRTDETVRVYKK